MIAFHILIAVLFALILALGYRMRRIAREFHQLDEFVGGFHTHMNGAMVDLVARTRGEHEAYRQTYEADQREIRAAIGDIGRRLTVTESVQRTQAERIEKIKQAAEEVDMHLAEGVDSIIAELKARKRK